MNTSVSTASAPRTHTHTHTHAHTHTHTHTGLRKVHVFALCNVLRRPVVLVDGADGMARAGDFAAVYLPLLQAPQTCVDQSTGRPFMPLVVAWSSAGYNHYIPLVPVRGRTLPRMHVSFLPGVWGGDHLVCVCVCVCVVFVFEVLEWEPVTPHTHSHTHLHT
jgi:hypothetical protein